MAKTLLQSGDEETLALLENEEARKPLYEKAPEQQFVIMELGWLVGWVRDGALPLEGIENTFPIMSGG